jgi:hypothetical protein
MKAQYIVVYKVHGANKLSDESGSSTINGLEELGITAALTTDPESHFAHIDRHSALSAQILKALFTPSSEGTWQERLATEIASLKAKRAERSGSGLFLICKGDIDVSSPDLSNHRDLDEFAVAFDAVDKDEIRAKFRRSVQIVIAALSFSLPEGTDARIEKIGEVVFLLDPTTGKPTYTFSPKGGQVRLSLASPITPSALSEIGTLAAKLNKDTGVARPVALLVSSLDPATNDLQAFIAAWSALEILINATFKSTYGARWLAIMREGAPASAAPVFDRLSDVMKDKYRLTDKFITIASVLGSAEATSDAVEFRRLKKTRDELFHALDSQPLLPTDAVQRLALKYLRLHLSSSDSV